MSNIWRRFYDKHYDDVYVYAYQDDVKAQISVDILDDFVVNDVALALALADRITRLPLLEEMERRIREKLGRLRDDIRYKSAYSQQRVAEAEIVEDFLAVLEQKS